MKERYINLMDLALQAYSEEYIKNYFNGVRQYGLKEHGFPRLTVNIGILIAHGRRQQLTDLFIEMMDFCCEQIPQVKAANDFSVKEIVFCIMALEETGAIDRKHTEYWRNELKKIVPEKCYNVFARTVDDEVHNWAAFTMVSEWMRQYAGISSKDMTFIDTQAGSQIKFLDNNLMYRDPHEPMVYDMVTRGLFALMLHFGYDGIYREQWAKSLENTALLTLKMQSVTGELPFGGRSNQFIHNESHIGLLLEFFCSQAAAKGDISLARQYKLRALRAIENAEMYLTRKNVSHIKNAFPVSSSYGCENYAYFDKYMITVASFFYVAYLFCNDSVTPAEKDDFDLYTWKSSEHFHKLFMRSGEYFAEFDTAADPHYDCCGLGRLHRIGSPGPVCMSGPCTKTPTFKVDVEDIADISLVPGVKISGQWHFAADEKSTTEVQTHGTNSGHAEAEIINTFEDGQQIKSLYILDKDGMHIKLTGKDEVAFMLPAFAFDGEVHPEHHLNGNELEIVYGSWKCRYEADRDIFDLGLTGCNRNGHYRAFAASGNKELNLKIEILSF